MEVEGTKPRERLRKSWWDGVKHDMKGCSLYREDISIYISVTENGEGKLN